MNEEEVIDDPTELINEGIVANPIDFPTKLMYEVVSDYPVDIFATYVTIIASCVLLYPIARVIYFAVERGVSRWR